MAAAKNAEIRNGPALYGFVEALKSSDVQFAVGVVSIILMMIVPLPPFILDILMSISISMSLLILLISIYVKEPLEFSTFPTLLLLTTLFRLALNVGTTRGILLGGATGHVSKVVQAFGEFVVGGNYFVGFVIFIILVIINFIVITKGAGRVAEVGARFTLDAMPGKQMAIDAELNNGSIDRDEAKRRRSKVEHEANFYGSMDGASKFVRGDAIAGLIITGINIIVGLILGVVQYKLSFADAAAKFTLLTVGDGLVSQIPALIISTASGIVVTRASGGNDLSEELSGQLFIHPKAMYVCSALLALLGILPGMPLIPFALLAGGMILLARYAGREVIRRQAAKLAALDEKNKPEAKSDSVEALLHLDTLALEVGVELVPLVDTAQDGEVLERIASARKTFTLDIGIIVPMVMIRDNIQLRPDEYQILLKGNIIGGGKLMPRRFLAMDPGDVLDPIDGHKTKEPAYGLDAIWIAPGQRDEATFRGYTVVNSSTVIVTHLTKLIQDHAGELIGRQEVHSLVEGLKRDHEKVVDEVIAADRLNLGDVVKVLQNLLTEGVSIRDLLSVFETLADHCKTVRHPDALTRYVRKALGRGIIKKYLSPDNQLVVINLDRMTEDVLVSGINQLEDGSTSLNIDPQQAQSLLNNIFESMRSFETSGTQPILLCGSRVRWDLRKMISRFIPSLTVLAFDEIPKDIQTKNIGSVTF
ncbi:MAG: flagellar biosynthesis protein FlhA [Proteobacteria bacterium]|nr:flagellar biosynthesis protein FlhA [Pseudomonadota bacterium]